MVRGPQDEQRHEEQQGSDAGSDDADRRDETEGFHGRRVGDAECHEGGHRGSDGEQDGVGG